MAYKTSALVNDQRALSTTSVEFLAANLDRDSVRVHNIDGVITVYIGVGTVTALNGIPILAGAYNDFPCVSALSALAASGTPRIAWSEYSS